MVFVNHIVDCQSPFVIFFFLFCTFYRKLKFLRKFNSGEAGDDLEFFRWYALAQAIKDWQATYDGLRELLGDSEPVGA